MVLLASSEYELSTPLLLIAVTAKYHVIPALSPPTQTVVTCGSETPTNRLYWPDAVP